MRNRKEGRKKRTIERERERDKDREREKGGGQKRLKRNKGRHGKNEQKCPFWGKTGFLLKTKEGKDKKKQQEKQIRRV